MNRRKFLTYAAAAGATTAFSNTLAFSKTMNNVSQERLSDAEELARHTIESIKFTSVKLSYPRLVGKNAVRGVHGTGPTMIVCTLTTDQGASGFGQIRGQRRAAEDLFPQQLKGKKLTDVFDLNIGVSDAASPFDIPLHDLAGVILRKPVYQILNGGTLPLQNNVPCYSGMIYMDDVDISDKIAGFDKILEECYYDYNKGYRQLKLKIGRGNRWMPAEEGLKRDVEITRLVQRYFPDIQILVDANDGYTPANFIRYLEQLEDIPLWWIEEPFRETVEDFTMLRKWLNDNRKRNTLLADGEARPDLPLALEMAKKQVLDIYLDDIMYYGFTPWRKLMPVMKEHGLTTSPHNWGDWMKTIYTAHIAWGLGNVCTVEGVTCFSNDIDFGLCRLDRGVILPSDAPGFGMTLLKQ